jgi:putative hydrolase of the HAD superfamily
MPNPPVRAVLWDFGGVLTTSPFDAFSEYEASQGLEPGLIRRLNSTNPDTNAWARLERSEITLEEFAAQFEAEAAGVGARVDATALMAMLRGELRPAMVRAVERCHERLKTGLLTNNFVSGVRAPAYEEVLAHFDVIVESSVVGHRKPDRKFYELACERLAIEPTEAVFLDDLGVNLKPARAMGMQTIKVTDAAGALEQLQAIVGFQLD